MKQTLPQAPASPNFVLQWWLSIVLMVASGFASLGYQIVWTQQCSLWLGHETFAVLAVLAAYFGGLAVGAFSMGPYIEWSTRPLRWYVGCETVIAIWSLALALLMQPFNSLLLDITGVEPTAIWQGITAFFGTFLLLFPATAAMGATLPAMERITTQLQAEGRSIASYYAANTFGAVIGVLLTAFCLVPELGLMRTSAICAMLNLLCAGVALSFLPQLSIITKLVTLAVSAEIYPVLLRLAFTGLLGIGYEVLVVRVLSQVSENTVYTFAMLLAVYLIGTAIGAAVYQTWLVRIKNPHKLTDRLLSALATACLISTASLWLSEDVKSLVLTGLGTSMAAAISSEALLALLAFALPTMVMGALFSHLSNCANAVGISFGRILAVNTLGATIAPLLFGVLLAPLLGPKLALLAIATAYLALTSKAAWLTPSVLAPATIAIALAGWAPPLAFIDVPDGGHVVSYKDGVMAAVSVVEDAEGVARLRINNRQQEGNSSSLLVDGRQALLPIFLHPAPQRALFLGLGTGMTAGSAAEDPSIHVDAVELLPEVIEASQYFRGVFAEKTTNPRLHIMTADARRYVQTTNQFYDVIISDNFHPARSGSGALYTVEHFRAVRGRLNDEGLFCQWLPLHQLDLETLRNIVQSFIAVYPDGLAMLASNSLETPVIGLVGKKNGSHFDISLLREHLASTKLPKSPAAFGIEDEFALLGSFIAGPKTLAHFAGNAAANTDDHIIVAYRAPRITYAPDSLPRDRLITLLHELYIKPEDIVDYSTDTSWIQRISAYWAARNRYIEAGRNVRPSANVKEMLKVIQEPLLAVLRISPDFRPAYDPLVRMATYLGQTDSKTAQALLTELIKIQPNRTEAHLTLDELSNKTP